MKILLITLILGSISYVGFKIGGAYKEKELFYKEFNNFLLYFKNQSNFLKVNILDIIDNFKTKNKNLISLFKNYKYALENNEKVNEIELLNEEENNEIINFLKELGKSDCFYQNEYLDKNLMIFNNKLENTSKDNLKYGVLYKKLGVLVAIFVGIILI